MSSQFRGSSVSLECDCAGTSRNVLVPVTPRAPGRFERGDAGEAESGVRERIGLGAQQFGKAAETLEQILGQRLDVGARVAGEQHDLEQLVIRQIVRSSRDQPLAQPLPVPMIMRRIVGPFGEAQLSGAALGVHRVDHRGGRRRARSSASIAPAMRAGSSVS